MDQFTNTPDTTANYAPDDIQNNKGMAILAYLSWLVLIPLFAAKNSPFARYHTNQGLILFLLGLVWGVATKIVTLLLGWIPILGVVIGILLGIASFVVGIFSVVCLVLGIVNAAQGKAKELPIIGGIRILK